MSVDRCTLIPVATQPRTPNPRGSGDLLRGELVGAARDLLLAPVERTPFSLRAVAKNVGVSPTAVYRHFASVDELVGAVADDQTVLLAEAIGEPTGPADADSLTELGVRYVRWGLANPGAYQLLFESADRLPHPVGPGTAGWAMVDALVAWLTPAGVDDPERVAIRAWTMLHGVTSLRLHKPELPWPTSVEDEVAALAGALLRR
jgi:AcrR family transcriptional regulator